ncbi:hypothetical protein F4824DRAFT_233044 [Ustulina deusta]|nr:hypothetical protein F4824DRAFT_233044 [Ustulina deusta]
MSRGPYFAEDGRCFYLMNGQLVWRLSERKYNSSDGDSSRAIAHLVSSTFEPHRLPSRSRSHPRPRSVSGLETRMEPSFLSRVKAGRSHSSVLQSNTDGHYRDDLEPEENQHSPPLDSDFLRRCPDSHNCDIAAKEAGIEHRACLGVSLDFSQPIRSASPGMYEDNPPETQHCHLRQLDRVYQWDWSILSTLGGNPSINTRGSTYEGVPRTLPVVWEDVKAFVL